MELQVLDEAPFELGDEPDEIRAPVASPGMVPETVPSSGNLEQSARSLGQVAQGMRVTDGETMERAASFLLAGKRVLAMADELFDPVVKANHAAWKAALAAKAKIADPTKLAIDLVGRRILDYNRAQRAIEDKTRAEMQRKADEAAKATLATTGIPVPAPIIPIIRTASIPQGLSVRTAPKAEVVDLMMLLQEIVGGRAPLTLVKVDQPALNKWAQATRGQIALPGVEVSDQETLAKSSRVGER